MSIDSINALKCKQMAARVKCPCERPNMTKSLSVCFYYVTILQTFTHQTEKLPVFGAWQVLNLDPTFTHCSFTYLNHLPICGAFQILTGLHHMYHVSAKLFMH